jgi:CrcB protein
MSAAAWFAFVLAAAIGAPLRAVVDDFVAGHSGGAARSGTFVVNVSGSFLLGVITGLALYHAFPDTARVVLGTGFCGAYTTFSAFSVETVRLLEHGETGRAFRATAGTVVVCGAAAAIGLALASI